MFANVRASGGAQLSLRRKDDLLEPRNKNGLKPHNLDSELRNRVQLLNVMCILVVTAPSHCSRLDSSPRVLHSSASFQLETA